jgi:hypothetical protein
MTRGPFSPGCMGLIVNNGGFNAAPIDTRVSWAVDDKLRSLEPSSGLGLRLGAFALIDTGRYRMRECKRGLQVLSLLFAVF